MFRMQTMSIKSKRQRSTPSIDPAVYGEAYTSKDFGASVTCSLPYSTQPREILENVPMDTSSDLWGDLPLDDGIFNSTNVPPAKPDAAVSILTLPPEVLEVITEYCDTRTILSLMLTNHTLFSVALRRLYSNMYIHVDVRRRRRRSLQEYKRQFEALISLHKRPEYMASLRHLHLVKVSEEEAQLVHSLIQMPLENAPFLQSLILTDCDPIAATDYSGLVLPASLKHIFVPYLQRNITGAIPDAARLHTLRIAHGCASLDELQALGEKWASSLRHLQFVIDVQRGEPEPSMERIDEFASKFPNLESLQYGYCGCSFGNKVSPLIPWGSYT
jgi:hypothetical protein